MKTYTAEQFRKWGAKGGKKSRRVLTPEQAKAMVAAREARRNGRKGGRPKGSGAERKERE